MFDLAEVLEGAKTIGISGHLNPDGDCIGSCLGLYLYLKKNYPDRTVNVHLMELPPEMAFLEGAQDIIHTCDPSMVYDVFFCLDCCEEVRLGEFRVLYEQARKKVCIDHHVITGPFADVSYRVETASSTSELVCNLLGTQNLDFAMAQALYTGIIHDTGVFRYSCTSGDTLRTAAALMDKGIDCATITEDTFYSRTYVQTQILARALLESVRLLDGRVIFSVVRRKDMQFYGVQKSDLSGIVPMLREIEGVETAIFLYETGNQCWKVSMRSGDMVDVARICAYFGGGGHKKAAGCDMQGSVYDVVNNLTAHIEEQLNSAVAGTTDD